MKAVQEKRRLREEHAAQIAERKKQARAGAREPKSSKKNPVVVLQKPVSEAGKSKKSKAKRSEVKGERRKGRGRRALRDPLEEGKSTGMMTS